MSGYTGVLTTVPDRVTVRVHIPDDLLTEADRLADELGVDRAVLLGDLVASVLPDALAEAARELLSPYLSPDAERPGLPTRACSQSSTVTPTVPARLGADLDQEEAPGGTAG